MGKKKKDAVPFNGKVGFCPKCCEVRNLTDHHVCPVRFFGKDDDENQTKLLICRDCHDLIDKLIEVPKMKREDYFKITQQWLRGQEPTVIFR